LLELGSGFNPDFTGRENVYLNGALLGFTRDQIDEKFDAIAGFADIGQHLEQPVKTYSSGMLVRLAFAVQVQVDPDILIVDEALAVGDALFQKRCFQRLEKLISDGVSLLFVSHEQESVRTLTDKAILLSHGSSIAYGLSSDVILEYRSLLHREEKNLYRQHAIDTTKKVAAKKQGNEAAVKHQKLKSFGDLEAEIVAVKVCDLEGNESNYFRIGEEINFSITFRTSKDLENLNVAFRIRNKEGVKITSWGTLNDDMRTASEASRSKRDLFWHRTFRSGDTVTVNFSASCRLGPNFYELQATVTRERDMFYGSQEVLHWKDEAAFFTVALKPQEHVVGGICDLGFTYEVMSD
jgi:lipopolysaccharide transport system ATP-binding protein